MLILSLGIIKASISKRFSQDPSDNSFAFPYLIIIIAQKNKSIQKCPLKESLENRLAKFTEKQKVFFDQNFNPSYQYIKEMPRKYIYIKFIVKSQIWLDRSLYLVFLVITRVVCLSLSPKYVLLLIIFSQTLQQISKQDIEVCLPTRKDQIEMRLHAIHLSGLTPAKPASHAALLISNITSPPIIHAITRRQPMVGFPTNSKSTLYNCTSCLNLSSPNPVCTSCNVSFFLNASTSRCDLCSTMYPDCYHCLLTIPHCIVCNWGWYIIPNYTCVRCPASLGTLCQGCYNQTQCRLCLPGWGFSAPNVCVPCNNTLSYCAACVDIYTCYLCVNVFNIVMVNGSKCVTCQTAISRCQNCTSNYTTASCSIYYGVNYTVFPNTCVLCSFAIQNCLTCPNYTFCNACINNGYSLNQSLNSVNDTFQVCLPCSSYLTLCSKCTSSPFVCTDCIHDGLHLYNPTNFDCVSCSYFLTACSKCLPNRECIGCQSNRYAISSSKVCQVCALFMQGCFYCNSTTTCTLCMGGKLVTDQSGCSNTLGCMSANPILPVQTNCIACDTMQFLPVPSRGECICIDGWVVGSYCTPVLGCTATKWVVNKSQCFFCSATQHFILKNASCICALHYKLNGTKCIQICGDGFIINHACDDGNTIDGDGCSSTCHFQPQHACTNDNSRFPSTKCIFQAKIGLSLSSVSSINANFTKAIFKISPYSEKIGQMDVNSLVTLNAPGSTKKIVEVSNGQLIVYFEHTQKVDQQTGQVGIRFDYTYVKSPSISLDFLIVQTDYVKEELNKVLTQAIKALSYLSISTFVLGSFAFKMIGVEILYTFQIIRMLQATSQYYNSFFVQFQGMNYIYGQVSSFSGSAAPVSSNFDKLGFRDSLTDNNLILAIINGAAILVYGSIMAYTFKLKLQIQSSDILGQAEIPPQIRAKNKRIGQKIEKTNRIAGRIYDWMVFPLFMGFMIHSMHTSIVYESNISSQHKQLIDFLSLFTSFFVASVIFHYQLFYNTASSEQILDKKTHNKYIPYFLTHHLIIFILLTFMLVMEIQILYFAIGGLLLINTIYLISRRPYVRPLCNFSIVFNSMFTLFGLLWVITKNCSFDTPEASFWLLCLFVGLGYIVNLLGVVRSMLILKDIILNRENEQPYEPIDKSTQPYNKIDINRLKFDAQQQNMFMVKLIKQNREFHSRQNPIIFKKKQQVRIAGRKKQIAQQIKGINYRPDP